MLQRNNFLLYLFSHVFTWRTGGGGGGGLIASVAAYLGCFTSFVFYFQLVMGLGFSVLAGVLNAKSNLFPCNLVRKSFWFNGKLRTQEI